MLAKYLSSFDCKRKLNPLFWLSCSLPENWVSGCSGDAYSSLVSNKLKIFNCLCFTEGSNIIHNTRRKETNIYKSTDAIKCCQDIHAMSLVVAREICFSITCVASSWYLNTWQHTIQAYKASFHRGMPNSKLVQKQWHQCTSADQWYVKKESSSNCTPPAH